MAADVLSASGVSVVLQDHMRSPGRKLLLAGRGGLNLTHSEPLDKLLSRYGSSRARLEPAIRSFPPDAVRQWCADLGEPTFVGSSGRVFPVAMKSSPLLRKWLRKLSAQGVTFMPGKRWQEFSSTPTILALGGASWPELGSDATWVDVFRQHQIAVTPFAAANSRQRVAWSTILQERHAGAHIKNVTLTHNGNTSHGDIVIARDGLEGTPVYALSQSLRENPGLPLILDLKPGLIAEHVTERLARQRAKDTQSSRYRKAFGLTPPAVALMLETKSSDPKGLRIKTEGPVELRRAISSAGGVSWDEVDEEFRLRKQPNTMVVGEMLDWEAPTGGYLLQACFSMGHFAANRFLQTR